MGVILLSSITLALEDPVNDDAKINEVRETLLGIRSKLEVFKNFNFRSSLDRCPLGLSFTNYNDFIKVGSIITWSN